MPPVPTECADVISFSTMVSMSPTDAVRRLYEDAEERRRLAARLQGEASGLEEAAARLESGADLDVHDDRPDEAPIAKAAGEVIKMRRRRK